MKSHIQFYSDGIFGNVVFCVLFGDETTLYEICHDGYDNMCILTRLYVSLSEMQRKPPPFRVIDKNTAIRQVSSYFGDRSLIDPHGFISDFINWLCGRDGLAKLSDPFAWTDEGNGKKALRRPKR